MTFLYTQEGCRTCTLVKAAMHGQLYHEVVLDNPLLDLGIRTAIEKPMAAVPLLVNVENGLEEIFYAGVDEKGVLTLLKVI